MLASWVSLLVDGGVSSKGRALLLPLLDCKDYTGISKLQGRGEAGVEAPSFDTKRRPLNQSGSFLGWWITIYSKMRKLRPHFCVGMSWRVWGVWPVTVAISSLRVGIIVWLQHLNISITSIKKKWNNVEPRSLCTVLKFSTLVKNKIRFWRLRGNNSS